ncbi:MAG: hypothetical protein V7K69_20570 [Nostoc sp.]|uniref:hypothetical protein n=1 Tax=Nostoc sp. TaxID=1180 RepID=UPI002FF89FB5
MITLTFITVFLADKLGLKLRKKIQNDAGKCISVGMATAAVLVQPVLTENTHADMCVVGAEIVWMSSVLTDAGKIISGHTG